MAPAFDTLPEAVVLTAEPAPVPIDWAAAVLQAHWGVDGTLAPLSGERDANFRVDADDGTRWLFKAAHPIEPPEVTDYQTQALDHLARHAPALPVQRLRPTRGGALSLALTAPDGRPRVLRLISWLEGLPAPQAPRTAALRDDVARMQARLHRALATLRHPAEARQLPWDLQRAEAVDSLLDQLPQTAGQPQRLAMARGVLRHHVAQVRGALAALPRQAIHNDFNLYNLLVQPDAPARVSGVLDFGDMLAAPRICDVAVAASYQLDDADGAASLASVAQFAAAYHAESPLTAYELELLWPLVQARLVMVVATSGWRAQRQPDQADYLLRNNAISWQRLAATQQVDPAAARQALHAACPAPSAQLSSSASTDAPATDASAIATP